MKTAHCTFRAERQGFARSTKSYTREARFLTRWDQHTGGGAGGGGGGEVYAERGTSKPHGMSACAKLLWGRTQHAGSQSAPSTVTSIPQPRANSRPQQACRYHQCPIAGHMLQSHEDKHGLHVLQACMCKTLSQNHFGSGLLTSRIRLYPNFVNHFHTLTVHHPASRSESLKMPTQRVNVVLANAATQQAGAWPTSTSSRKAHAWCAKSR